MVRRAALPIALALLAFAAQDGKLGYDDTPLLPGTSWHVHDGARPQPTIVAPGAVSTGTAPPADAVVLFDGSDLSAWRQADGEPARWRLADGAMEVDGSGDIETIASFGDVQLHLEWATPAEVSGDGQGRGNSGVFFFGRYEVQILDSFDNPTYPDGQAAALYGQHPPLVNASRGPGEWQSYDIVFRSPRFEEERLLSPARATVLHNGVLVQDAQEFLGTTAHRKVATYAPHAPEGPLRLQDHGNPVRFRNVWVRRL